MSITGSNFPPPHWPTEKMEEEYHRAAEEYRRIMLVTPEQDMRTFERADALLEDAQDLRDALARRGVDTKGVLLP